MDETFDYCREIESYLCKKNEGHLIRIVGPAFEMVRGWADQGIPLKIALRGIDRTCERLATKTQRRRPLRIEFCEADVLDAFDDWRRAIGTGVDRVSESPPPPRKSSLAEHIARAVSRLVAVRLNGNSERLGQTIAHAIAVLDELAGSARQSRGEARAQIIARLADLDAELMSAARATVDATTADALRREVEADLAPFAAKMADDVRARAAAAAYERLLRESVSLPVLTYE
jgi:hypothetical protein